MPYTEDTKDKCEACGKEYKRISQHWSIGECDHPPLTSKQKEIAIGLLMGDGNIDRRSKNPYIRTKMISPNYLEYISNIFEKFSRGVRKDKTAKEVAAMNRESEFSPNADAEDYHDVYAWSSVNHPDLQELSEWYSSGEKMWPNSIELTPTVLKHWYCGDGCYNRSGTNNNIKISMSNEVDETEKVDKMFEKVGLPSPSNYNINERKDGSLRCDAEFTVEASEQILEYMGEPLPDFEYKW